MAITIDAYSTQAAKGPPTVTQAHTPVKANEYRGRLRMSYFDYTVPTGDLAAASNLALCRIPQGARILAGKFVGEDDLSAATGTTTIGLSGVDDSGFIDAAGSVADDVDLLMAATDTSTGAVVDLAFAETAAHNFGYVTEKEVWLVATPTTAAYTAAKTLSGYVMYVVD